MSEKKERVFVRGISSGTYVLDAPLKERLSAPRVRGKDFRSNSLRVGTLGGIPAPRTRSLIAPGDKPFLTQSLQVHFVEIPPRESNGGHAHQNEAAFYIVEGAGYEIHDGRRYEWSQDDVVVVHNDSVHRHFNPNDKPALTLVFKTKPTWMFLGLIQQGRETPEETLRGFGPREDWSALWTPGATEMRKVIKGDELEWVTTPYGRLCRYIDAESDARIFSVDLVKMEIPAGSRSGRRWQMADEVLYVLNGSGYSLHWEVRAEFADKYYAHIAEEPSRHEFGPGDFLYIPPNTVAQHFSTDGPLVVLSAQSRLYQMLGYGNTVFFEKAPA